MDSKYNLILRYLKSKGIENISKAEKKSLFRHFEDIEDIQQVKEEIDLLVAMNRSMISTYCKLSVNSMLEIYKNIDFNLLSQLFLLYDEMKEYSKNELKLYREFSKVIERIMIQDEALNVAIGRELSDGFNRSLQLKNSLYLVMCDKDKADAVFTNCVNRSKLFFRNCDCNNLEEIIHFLKTEYSLSNDDLVKISKKCASFFSASSASKIDNLYKQIEGFKKFIKDQEMAVSSGIEVNRLLNREFKDVLFEASSVATYSEESINKTLKFLMGGKLGTLTKCSKKVFSVKGEFTPYQLAKIYNESLSSLSVSVEKIADVCTNLSIAFNKQYKEELDLNKLINGLNFRSLSQLRKEDYLDNEKLDAVFDLLSMFVSKDDMENLLRNNLTFLTVPVNVMKNSLQRAVLISRNKDELRYNVLQKIRNHFDMYQGQFKDVERHEGIIAETYNKVRIKDIDEEEIREVLSKLETEQSDIDLWKKKWNDEEREYRNLQIQIELEDINEELASIESFLNFEFSDIYGFLEEMEIIKNMLIEVDGKYNDVMEVKRLNRSLEKFSVEVKQKIDSLYSDIDNRIDNVVAMYRENISNLEKEIALRSKEIASKEKILLRRNELDKIIMEKSLSKEHLRDLEKNIREICDFIRGVNPVAKSIRRKELEGSKLVSEFFEFLQKSNADRILNSGKVSVEKNLFSEDYFYKDKFNKFIYCLEFEGLIADAIAVTSIPYSGKKFTYQEYRRSLGSEERKYTDKIYRLYKENMDDKENIKETAKKYIEKYGLEDSDEYTSSQRLDILCDYADVLVTNRDNGLAIVQERDKVDKDIEEVLILLKNDEREFSDLIKQYLKNIELLRNCKIKR